LIFLKKHAGIALISGDLFFVEKGSSAPVIVSRKEPLTGAYSYGGRIYLLRDTETGILVELVERLVDFEVVYPSREPLFAGKSVNFTLRGINIFRPEYAVTVRDEAGRTVADFKIPAYESPSFAFLPPTSGKFTMQIRAAGGGIEIKKDIELTARSPLELLAIIRFFYRGLL
jgi:hypothetical protein